MNIIFFLIGCSVLVALIFLAAFFWANKSGQHEDLYTPSVRILFEDEPEESTTPAAPSSQNKKVVMAPRDLSSQNNT